METKEICDLISLIFVVLKSDKDTLFKNKDYIKTKLSEITNPDVREHVDYLISKHVDFDRH